jgi:hypothetical protein
MKNENNNANNKSKDETITNICILGAGDVVKNRLLPALDTSDFLKNIKIYDLPSVTKIEYNNKTIEVLPITNLIKNKNENAIVWIATPSNTHLYYLKQMMNKSKFIVVEKPVVSNRSDLEELKKFVNCDKRQSTFFLSYYILEKALPLTYLILQQPVYEKYLIYNNKDFSSQKDICYNDYHSLGTLQYVGCKIAENIDNRKLPAGGQFMETFIHLLLISSMILQKTPDQWGTNIHFDLNKENLMTASKINLQTQVDHVDVQLLLDKTLPIEKSAEQICFIEYSNGLIELNLKQKSLIMYNEIGEIIGKLSVAPQYKEKYSVLVHMVYDCYKNNYDCTTIDGLGDQMKVIEWMLDVLEKENI